MEFYIASATDKGVKRATNQDSLFAGQFTSACRKYAFAVLCDGMGGLQHGEVASASIAQAFSIWAGTCLPARTEPFSDHEIRKEWTAVVEQENRKLLDYGEKNACHIGSTVTAMLLSESRFYILNIGDTRAYELYKGARQLTEDHTVIAEEIKLGNMTPEQARISPMRNVLTRCVGAGRHVYPDLFFGGTQPGAVYLLCSDGFRHCISPQEMREHIVPQTGDPVRGLRGGEEYLIGLVKERGEKDNISAVAVYAEPDTPKA